MSRIALFIDWQNTYKSAREAFGWRDWPNEYGNYSPFALTRRCETAIIFSHDTDLLPAIEAMIRLGGQACVETASWVSPTFESRLRPRPSVFHHALAEEAFLNIERRINYAQQG